MPTMAAELGGVTPPQQVQVTPPQQVQAQPQQVQGLGNGQPMQSKFCSSCGVQIPANSMFCGTCGATQA